MLGENVFLKFWLLKNTWRKNKLGYEISQMYMYYIYFRLKGTIMLFILILSD